MHRLSRNLAGLGHLAAPPARDHLIDHPRLPLEDAAVMRSSGLDDFAAAAEERIAELDDAQIGPGSRASANHRKQRLLGWPVGLCLCQDQRGRRSRARYSGVAMNQKMGIPCLAQVASKGEEELDILPLRHGPSCTSFDNIVEAQLEPLVRVEVAKGLGLWPAGIQNRQHVGD